MSRPRRRGRDINGVNAIGSLRVLDSVPILLMPTDRSLKNVR